MKRTFPELAQRYADALRDHLRSRPPHRTAPARHLGHAAVAAGCDAAALARLHGHALCALPADVVLVASGRLLRRATVFFSAALRPVERNHRAALGAVRRLQRQSDALSRHHAVLAAGNLRLQREVARRRVGEAAALRAGRARYRELSAQSRFMQRDLRHLTRQVLSAQEEERRQISRELHDEVVQTLVGITVQLAALAKGAGLGARILRVRIARTRRLVEKSVRSVHRFARELRPAVLDDLGLIPALNAHLQTVAARHRLKIRLKAFAGVEALSNERRTVLFRVAQEALANVARHARASAVELEIAEIADGIRLAVRDNGRSFQVPAVLSAKAHQRLGLLGMRERVEMVGGALRITSAPGTGTTVSAEIPFQARSAA